VSLSIATVFSSALIGAFAVSAMTQAADAAYGPELQGFDYPYPVAHYTFTSQGVPLDMAYMDVKPEHANGKTAVLLHGKNFCAASWELTIGVLSKAGYRVIAPDQIGFCKSTKPEHYQYTFQQLAGNTQALLKSLGVDKAIIIGHSTGGMLAVRYALMYPNAVDRLVLVSPIGLEDWKAKGVPWQSIDAWYAQERKTTADSVREYERKTYYVGQWKPEFDKWVQMYAGMFAGPGKDRVAWNSALLYDMIYTQPVFYELGNLTVPVLLISGDKDNTAIGKNFAPPEVQAKLGHYDVLAKEAAAKIPNAKLVTFADLGHASWMQDPQRFHKVLLDALNAPP
jgi:pimeloyl-ACP methyl ester carboxylesterase